MTLEEINPEKSRPKIYLPEVRAIIENINSESENFLKKREKDLAGMSAKKDTLHHSQRMSSRQASQLFRGRDQILRGNMPFA